MYFTHPQFKNFTLKPFLKGFSEIDLRNKLTKIFPGSNIVFTDSGRSAFQLAINELKLDNSEMLVPAYICDIFSPIFEKYKIKPVYLDIDLKTFQPNFSEIERKITPQTKSILICHTYGLAVEMEMILNIAKRHNLKIIEDCAHILPSKIYGSYAFFSFAKICPNINGGMLVSRSQVKTEVSDYKPKLSNIVKFLRLYPCLAKISEKFRKEQPTKNGGAEKPKKASRLSLKFFDNYLKDYERKIYKKVELAKYFQKKLQEIGFETQKAENNTFTYLSALIPQNSNRDELFNKLKNKGVFCLRIWRNPLFPNLSNTSEAAKRIINFPLQVWFTKEDINKIIQVISS